MKFPFRFWRKKKAGEAQDVVLTCGNRFIPIP